MKTPKEWIKNLENGTITEEMLDAALYSVNKRAKNCRDQKRQYSHRYDKYHNADRYAEKESEYYEQKEKLLSALQPMCIHRESLGCQLPTIQIAGLQELRVAVLQLAQIQTARPSSVESDVLAIQLEGGYPGELPCQEISDQAVMRFASALFKMFCAAFVSRR